jgi:hypothetical protein
MNIKFAGTNFLKLKQTSVQILISGHHPSSYHPVYISKYKQDDVLDKNRVMDNVQKRNICTSVPSSQTSRSFLKLASSLTI